VRSGIRRAGGGSASTVVCVLDQVRTTAAAELGVEPRYTEVERGDAVPPEGWTGSLSKLSVPWQILQHALWTACGDSVQTDVGAGFSRPIGPYRVSLRPSRGDPLLGGRVPRRLLFPRINHRHAQVREMTHVQRGQRCPARQRDACNERVTHVDAPARSLALGRQRRGRTCSRNVEIDDAVLEVLFEEGSERGLEGTTPPSGRENRQAESSFEKVILVITRTRPAADRARRQPWDPERCASAQTGRSCPAGSRLEVSRSDHLAAQLRQIRGEAGASEARRDPRAQLADTPPLLSGVVTLKVACSSSTP